MGSDANFIDALNAETQLVWARYNAMVVANSIILGFIGVSFIAVAQNFAPKELTFGLAFGGGLLDYLWLFMTSLGWSLSKRFLQNTSGPIKDIYEKWYKEPWHQFLGCGAIWWCTHAIILLFLTGYIALAVWQSLEIWQKTPFWPWLSILTGTLAFLGPLILLFTLAFRSNSSQK